MKMKVRVDKLRAAIQKHVKQDAVRFEKETEKYVIAGKRAREKYITRVTAYLADVRGGGDIRQSYELSNYLERGCEFPREPKKAETHTDLLVKLDLVEDQVLVVDDHSDYMKFLSGKCVC